MGERFNFRPLEAANGALLAGDIGKSRPHGEDVVLRKPRSGSGAFLRNIQKCP